MDNQRDLGNQIKEKQFKQSETDQFNFLFVSGYVSECAKGEDKEQVSKDDKRIEDKDV